MSRRRPARARNHRALAWRRPPRAAPSCPSRPEPRSRSSDLPNVRSPPRSAPRSAASPRGRTSDSAALQSNRRGCAGSRGSQLRSPRSSAGSRSSYAARWRLPARAPRSSRRLVSRAGQGTAARRRLRTRHTAAVLRHRACRTRASTCRSPKARSRPSTSCEES